MRFPALLAALLLPYLVASAAASPPCPDDDILAVSRGDTLFVTHRHAERN